MRVVHLYGDLAEKYGSKHRLNVASIGEAIRALEANYKGFRETIRKKGKYEVVRGDTLKDEHLSEETARMNYGKGDFHIAPVVEGAGESGGIIMTIIGVALLVIAFFIPVTAPYLVPLGIGLIAGGVSIMLTPTPNNDDYGEQEDPAERNSFYFDGPTNTMEQGGVIPLVYGRMVVGSTVVSAGIKVESI